MQENFITLTLDAYHMLQREAAQAERAHIVNWLRWIEAKHTHFTTDDPRGAAWAYAGDWADEIEQEAHYG